MRVFAFLFAATMLSACLATEVEAEPFMARFAGTWEGSGTMRTSPDADREPVSCRSVARVDGSDKVVVEGKCATAGLNGTVSMTITETAAGVYDAAVQVTGSIVTYYYRGTGSGDRMEFQSLSPVLIDRVPHHSRFMIRFSGNDRFGMRETVVDVATGVASELVDMDFARQ